MKRSTDWHVSGWWALLLAPIAVPAALIAGLFARPVKRTPGEVIGYLRDFVEGTGGEWDWDDFTSAPIKDKRLDEIRRDADMIALPLNTQGIEALHVLLERARALIP